MHDIIIGTDTYHMTFIIRIDTYHMAFIIDTDTYHMTLIIGAYALAYQCSHLSHIIIITVIAADNINHN